MWEKNCYMWCWNYQMWEKSKGTTKFEKRTVTCDVETTQCEYRTIKCEKKVTWYSKLPTSGYRTPPFFGGYRRITPFASTLSVCKGSFVYSRTSSNWFHVLVVYQFIPFSFFFFFFLCVLLVSTIILF